jgi:hypothetical protein
MTRPFGFCAGKVCWVGSGETKSGRAYAVVQIEMAGRPYGNEGKVFKQRVTINDYAQKEQVQVGDFVAVGGELEAKIEQSQGGRSFAVIVLTGRVQRMEIPVAETEVQEADDAGEPQR